MIEYNYGEIERRKKNKDKGIKETYIENIVAIIVSTIKNIPKCF